MDLNFQAKGFQMDLTMGSSGFAVTYYDMQPAESCVSSDAQLIKVNGT
jgi:hypothetical protein